MSFLDQSECAIGGSLTPSCDNPWGRCVGEASVAVRRMLNVRTLRGSQARPVAVIVGLVCGMLGLSVVAAVAEPDISSGGDSARPQVADQSEPISASTDRSSSPEPTLPAVAPGGTPADGARRPQSRSAAGNVPKSLPEDDYYAKRAKDLLGGDRAQQSRERSLQAAYPGFNVVVCEAGCYGTSRKLVQFEPIRTIAAANTSPVAAASSTGQLQLTAASISAEGATAAAQQPEHISCVAGCYGTSRARNYPAASHKAAVDAARAEIERIQLQRSRPAAAWQPGSQPASHSSDSAGSWVTTVAKADAAAKATTTATAKDKSGRRSAFARHRQSSPSGEWFKRINDDRGRAVR